MQNVGARGATCFPRSKTWNNILNFQYGSRTKKKLLNKSLKRKVVKTVSALGIPWLRVLSTFANICIFVPLFFIKDAKNHRNRLNRFSWKVSLKNITKQIGLSHLKYSPEPWAVYCETFFTLNLTSQLREYLETLNNHYLYGNCMSCVPSSFVLIYGCV